MKSILVTGLCTLHWGRLQYGNIGNYYIIEPLFRQLHEHFKEYRILTTFQMDEKFIEKENIEVLPMDLYYVWDAESDVNNAKNDVEIAEKYMNNKECKLSPYVKVLLDCEYVINVSGDMWGDNAEHVGHDRFLVDCLKMQTAQILKKKTILYAVTPGPFEKSGKNDVARDVFSKFDLVVIREKISMNNLIKWGFPVDKVVWAPCPSFLFDRNEAYESKWTWKIEESHGDNRKIIGLTFGGFNMPCGPYDMWPREEEQFEVFVSLVEYIIDELHANIMIFSHTNGFELPPKFKLINGRDFIILEELYRIVLKRHPEYCKYIFLVDEPLLPCNIKKLIGTMDMLITGRVHASVASVSQCVPTVYVEYEQNVIYSDKMSGFSAQVGMEEYVCAPGNLEEIKKKVQKCYTQISETRGELNKRIPQIKECAINIFDKIKNL
ncbi:MAG: polysaccharide pyruvyl transferase family protein [Lachnospiraceae bacterium]|nr:polysaccharide pyruvyl transferase family protein [Lachnospiraceae bacterium]